MQAAGYRIQETVHQGKRFTVYHAFKQQDQRSCYLKVLEKRGSAEQALHAARQEYELLARIASDAVIRPLDHFEDERTIVLVLEDMQGAPLSRSKISDVEVFMEIAQRIARGLTAIHRQQIIHKDINPSNLLRNPQTGVLKIIDFDIAAAYNLKVVQSGSPERLEGTLPYISPEQTGRINRTVDTRSDLYSLGGTLYELLTGQLPFAAQDPLELVHAHLAKMPVPPCEILDNFQLTIDHSQLSLLSELIMKLLAKNPEDRYQSAEGVLYDLELIQQATQTGFETLSGFTLGTRDFSDRLHIPEDLYGREQELQQLRAAYQRVSRGARELLLVAGSSGTGKTALVNALQVPVTGDRGYFVSGKYELLQRNIPYFGFLQAIAQFCNLLLTEQAATLAAWRQTMQPAVGDLGQVLTDLIPPLAGIIGPQPDVPPVGGNEARNRFHFVMQRFLRAIATAEHPLVVFLDDLQWADQASFDLLQLLLDDPQLQGLLLICAYRDNEVSAAHPFMVLLENLRTRQIPLSTIAVADLIPHDLRAWVAATVHTSDVDDLAELIFRKTHGNPFFTVQFLTTLYKEQILRFDASRAGWTWELAAIERMSVSENVVDLVLRRLHTLPQSVQAILPLAACIGHTFDRPTLALLAADTPEAEVSEALNAAMHEQLLTPLDAQRCAFGHDRVQQAAYDLIPVEKRAPLHLHIGRVLFRQVAADEQELERQIFVLVKHFNLALDLLGDPAERRQVARLNLRAAQKARAAIAYQTGWDYAQQALRLLTSDAWQQDYALTLALYHEALHLVFLSGHYSDMQRLGETLERNAAAVMDLAPLYEYQIQSLVAQNEFSQAVETFLSILAGLGIHVPRTPDAQEMGTLAAETHALLEAKGVEGLTNLPPMQDAEKQLALRLYLRSASLMILAAQELYPFMINKMLSLCLQDGQTPETIYLLTEYGFLNTIMGNLPAAYKYTCLSLELLQKLQGFEGMKVVAKVVSYLYTLHWKHAYKELCQLFWDLQQKAITLGDLEMASYALMGYSVLGRYSAKDLASVQHQSKQVLDLLSQLKQPFSGFIAEVWYQVIDRLSAEDIDDPTCLHVNIEDFLPVVTDEVKLYEQFHTRTARLFLNRVFEKDDFLECDDIVQKSMILKIGPGYADYAFEAALMILQRLKKAAPPEQPSLLEDAQTRAQKIHDWAEFGPENFLHRSYLLHAELAAIREQPYEAAAFYDRAIAAAQQHQVLCDEALSYELAAKFYMRREREDLAAWYLQNARACYQQWGAKAKVKHLDEHYPKYLRQGASVSQDGTSRGTDSTTSLALDVHTLLKASQTLSGEVQLSGLFEKMLHILIENAGARRGVFLEARLEQLLVQADGAADGVTGLLQAVPLEEVGNVPLTVINYVARSKQPLVFDHLTKETAYAHDPYIQQQQPVSVVCFPVLKQGELAAILYLENDLVEGAFTPARLEILNLLSAQIAISVENAELYEHLEEKVRQRTAELREAHEALAESHKAITDSVDYASRIQEAVLPAEDLLADLLPEHFILFQPRSVVSGDFYWARQVEDRLIVAVADCTGHGVPGALVSMLGMAFLNELVPQLAAQGRLQAGTLLDELREKVKTAFKQEGRFMEQKDGMDIALCIFEPDRARLHFAGAYNPLYLIRDGELVEIKADRMPVGIHRREQPFSAQDVDLQSGDRLYLFSDGYADQDGGPQRTGFSKARFQELLLEIHQESLERQKDLLLQRFRAWKGDYPQRDDVLVFGLRV